LADPEILIEDADLDLFDDEETQHFEANGVIDPGGWIVVEQAADHARVGLPMIRKAFRDRTLKHVRVGRKDGPIRTRAAWVDAWMMRWVVEPTSG
jgi:hypothetical protein